MDPGYRAGRPGRRPDATATVAIIENNRSRRDTLAAMLGRPSDLRIEVAPVAEETG